MKKYIKPDFRVEKFTPNMSVAVCGYKFSCDAGVNTLNPNGQPGELWEIKDPKYQGIQITKRNRKKYFHCMTKERDKPGMNYFQACNVVHYIPMEEKPVFTWGFLTLGDGKGKTDFDNPIKVRIWSYPDPKDPGWLEIHATTLLDDPPLSNHS